MDEELIKAYELWKIINNLNKYVNGILLNNIALKPKDQTISSGMNFGLNVE